MLLDIELTTLKNCRGVLSGDGGGLDRREVSHRQVSDSLRADERQLILLICHKPGFSALPPGQNVPILVDRGLYISSERRFYRVLNAHGQTQRRGRARPPQKPSQVPRPRTQAQNEVWSWGTTYLPTRVRGLRV